MSLSWYSVAQERLIVFSQTGKNARLDNFNKNQVPKLDSLARVNGVSFELVTTERDIPLDVRILPSIYYLSSSKKSYYIGRYDAIDRIERFLKNEQAFDLPKTSFQRQNIYLYLHEHFAIGTRLKVTPNNGPGKDKSNFKSDFLKAFDGSIENLTYYFSYPFREQSKQFYLNVYPYLTEEGVYYISIEVFSQHHCKEAIYNNFKNPISGTDITKLGQKVSTLYEQLLPKLLIKPSIIGESVTLLQTSKRTKDWSDYGFSSSITQEQDHVDLEIQDGNYHTVSSSKLSPSLNFTFPSPVSNYNGHISDLSGDFKIKSQTISGAFKINLNKLDMGDDMLNSSVLKEMLFTDSLPNAKLSFQQPLDEIPSNQQISIQGELSLVGLKQKVDVITTFQPVSTTGKILVTATFSLDIRPFPTLEQPDGPAPQKHTLIVRAQFLAEPD